MLMRLAAAPDVLAVDVNDGNNFDGSDLASGPTRVSVPPTVNSSRTVWLIQDLYRRRFGSKRASEQRPIADGLEVEEADFR